MNYTILTANGIPVIVDLSQNGNKYDVDVWNKQKHMVTQHESFERYDDAERYFNIVCETNGIAQFIKEVEHDESDFDFD